MLLVNKSPLSCIIINPFTAMTKDTGPCAPWTDATRLDPGWPLDASLLQHPAAAGAAANIVYSPLRSL